MIGTDNTKYFIGYVEGRWGCEKKNHVLIPYAEIEAALGMKVTPEDILCVCQWRGASRRYRIIPGVETPTGPAFELLALGEHHEDPEAKTPREKRRNDRYWLEATLYLDNQLNQMPPEENRFEISLADLKRVLGWEADMSRSVQERILRAYHHDWNAQIIEENPGTPPVFRFVRETHKSAKDFPLVRYE